MAQFGQLYRPQFTQPQRPNYDGMGTELHYGSAVGQSPPRYWEQMMTHLSNTAGTSARPSHQQYIIKSQKRETFRQMTGTGSNSFTIPAMMIGTEQKIVTKMVNTILSKRVIAASILVIMNLFKRLAIDSALKKRKAQILAENDPNNG